MSAESLIPNVCNSECFMIIQQLKGYLTVASPCQDKAMEQGIL